MILTETYHNLYTIYLHCTDSDILSFEDFINREQEKRSQLLNKSLNQLQ